MKSRHGLNRMVIAPGALSALLLLASGASLSCDEQAAHPEAAAFNALRDSLRSQEQSLVEVRYALGGEPRVGQRVPVTLMFWPTGSEVSGRFKVTPSSGVQLSGMSGTEEIPTGGSIEFDVVPTQPGYNYLKVETIVRHSGKDRTRAMLIAIPAGVVEVAIAGQPDRLE